MADKDKDGLFRFYTEIFTLPSKSGKKVSADSPLPGHVIEKAIEKFGYIDPPNKGNGGGVSRRTTMKEWSQATGIIYKNKPRGNKKIVNEKGEKITIALSYEEQPYGYYACESIAEYDEKIRKLSRQLYNKHKELQIAINARNSDPLRRGIPIDFDYKDDDQKEFEDFMNAINP